MTSLFIGRVKTVRISEKLLGCLTGMVMDKMNGFEKLFIHIDDFLADTSLVRN